MLVGDMEGLIEGGMELRDYSSLPRRAAAGAAAPTAAVAAAAIVGKVENPYRPAPRRSLPVRAALIAATVAWRCYTCAALVVLTGMLCLGATASMQYRSHFAAVVAKFKETTNSVHLDYEFANGLAGAAATRSYSSDNAAAPAPHIPAYATAAEAAAAAKAAAAAFAAKATDPQCVRLYDEATRRWARRVCSRREAARGVAFSLSVPSWDVWDPEHDCEVWDRFGANALTGFKPRTLCGAALLAQTPNCLVYSFRSSDGSLLKGGPVVQSSFLIELRALAPNCEIHIFDPIETAESASRHGLGFALHPLGLGGGAQQQTTAQRGGVVNIGSAEGDDGGGSGDGTGGSGEGGGNGGGVGGGLRQPLLQIMDELGDIGRELHVLQLDCGDCICDALPEQVLAPMARGEVQVHQLLVMGMRVSSAPAFPKGAAKVHITRLIEAFDAAGLRAFHKDSDHLSCMGLRFADYSLVSAAWARAAFHASHCPDTVASPQELGFLRARLPCD